MTELLRLAALCEAGSGQAVAAVTAMRERIWDGCELNVPPATAGFALAVALRELAAQQTGATNDAG